MQNVETSIELNAPIWRVFQNWKRYDFVPRFVPNVREVRYVEANLLYWRESHAGQEHEMTFEITPDLQKNSIAWKAMSGPENCGTVIFEPRPDGATRITLRMNYDPDAGWHDPAAVTKRLQSYLRGIKKFIDSAPPIQPPPAAEASRQSLR